MKLRKRKHPFCWELISNNEFPKDKWLIIETSDSAHHIAYYSSSYDKWESNSKFGGKPKWWATVTDANMKVDNVQ